MAVAGRSWPRRLRRLCVLVALGLATTLVSSLVFAQPWWWNLWIDRVTFSGRWFYPQDGRQIWWYSERVLGYTRLYARATHPEDYLDDPSWRRMPGPPDSTLWLDLELQEGEDWNVIAVGWPWRALKCGETALHRTGFSQWGAWRIPWGRPDPSAFPPPERHVIMVPYVPVWSGLALNTLFYALLWWVGFGAARVAKQNRRFRRGLCPVCRYDLKADYSRGCPECGWRR